MVLEIDYTGLQKGDKVLVAMSGGVDSTAVVLALQEYGCQVIGATLDLHSCSREAIQQAHNLAERLHIEHRVLDVREVFRREILNYFFHSYQQGLTPSPCILCNQLVKMRSLADYAHSIQATAFCTGHYVRQIFKYDLGTTTTVSQGKNDYANMQNLHSSSETIISSQSRNNCYIGFRHKEKLSLMNKANVEPLTFSGQQFQKCSLSSKNQDSYQEPLARAEQALPKYSSEPQSQSNLHQKNFKVMAEQIKDRNFTVVMDSKAQTSVNNLPNQSAYYQPQNDHAQNYPFISGQHFQKCSCDSQNQNLYREISTSSAQILPQSSSCSQSQSNLQQKICNIVTEQIQTQDFTTVPDSKNQSDPQNFQSQDIYCGLQINQKRNYCFPSEARKSCERLENRYPSNSNTLVILGKKRSETATSNFEQNSDIIKDYNYSEQQDANQRSNIIGIQNNHLQGVRTKDFHRIVSQSGQQGKYPQQVAVDNSDVSGVFQQTIPDYQDNSNHRKYSSVPIPQEKCEPTVVPLPAQDCNFDSGIYQSMSQKNYRGRMVTKNSDTYISERNLQKYPDDPHYSDHSFVSIPKGNQESTITPFPSQNQNFDTNRYPSKAQNDYSDQMVTEDSPFSHDKSQNIQNYSSRVIMEDSDTQYTSEQNPQKYPDDSYYSDHSSPSVVQGIQRPVMSPVSAQDFVATTSLDTERCDISEQQCWRNFEDLPKSNIVAEKQDVSGDDCSSISYPTGSDLYVAADLSKDQSYFLWAVEKTVLEYCRFPLGKALKQDIYQYVQSHGIMDFAQTETNHRQESQDLCFSQLSEYQDFFRKPFELATAPTAGKIVHINGQVLGTHPGLQYYTIGQRKGLGIGYAYPLYVVAMHTADNTLIVGPVEALQGTCLQLAGVNLLDQSLQVQTSWVCLAKIRFNTPPTLATVTYDHLRQQAQVKFLQPVSAITKGQGCAFYAQDEHGLRLLGGGWIV